MTAGSIIIGDPPPRTTPTTDRLDVVVALGLLVLCGLLLAAFSWRSTSPEEDAAILMRYAVNLANGHGIVFNPSGPRVDGATDIGFMALVAGVVWLGVHVERAAQIVNSVAYVVLVVGIYWSLRRFLAVSRIAAVLVAVFVATGTALQYTRVGFGTPTFALAVAAIWVLAEITRARPATTRLYMFLALAIILAGLVRPEGFAIGGLALVSLLVSSPRVWRRVLECGAVVTAGAVAFVGWRWSYFGYPLPNPYYKKGGGTLHLDGAKTAATQVAHLAWPFLVIIAIALVFQSTRRHALAEAVAIIGFSGMWVLLSSETDFAGRFQYPGMIIAAIGAASLIPGLGDELRTFEFRVERVVVVTVSVLLALFFVARAADQRGDTEHEVYDRVVDVLAANRGPGRVIVTTEAGLIPLRSGWTAIDAWGLNDERIAHHGVITEQYLQELNPDVIFMHVATSTIGEPAGDVSPGGKAGFGRMTDELISYAEDHDYVLAVDWGSEVDASWAVYVDEGVQDAGELVEEFKESTPDGMVDFTTIAPHLPLEDDGN